MNLCPVAGKVMHPTYGEAKCHLENIARRREIGKRHGASLVIYCCRYCRHWHVAHGLPKAKGGTR